MRRDLPDDGATMKSKVLRRRFALGLWQGLAVVWSVLSSPFALMAALGLAVAATEGWPLADGLYFPFVSGLTIGFGDLVPVGPSARVLAIAIELIGILFTALVASVGVLALRSALHGSSGGLSPRR